MSESRRLQRWRRVKGPGEKIKAQVLVRTDRKAGGRDVGWISNELVGSRWGGLTQAGEGGQG